MKKKLEELLNYLEEVHLDERERYVTDVKSGTDSYTEILSRERYLEFVLEITLNELMNLIDDLEVDES